MLQSAAQSVAFIDESVTVTVNEDVSSIPITDDTMLESIVRILMQNAVRYGSDPSEVRVSTTDRDDTLSIEVRTDDRAELDGTVDRQFPWEIRDLEIPGVSGSELYILRGLTDSYGGEIRIVDDGQDGFGFTVEFPVDRFLSESVRSC